MGEFASGTKWVWRVAGCVNKRAKRKKLKADHEVWTEIRYLENHGAEGHLRLTILA